NGSHFDGRGGLNSLGRQKLDLMLRDDDAGPVVIYLDLSRPAASARANGASPVPFDVHRESVRVYLADRGLDESQFEFRAGPNAGDTSPARDGLRGLTELHADSNGSAKSAPMTSR